MHPATVCPSDSTKLQKTVGMPPPHAESGKSATQCMHSICLFAVLSCRRNEVFLTGHACFLRVKGAEMLQHRLDLSDIPTGWRIATTLTETDRYIFQTASYAELIDRPVEMGLIEFLDFEAAGIPHTLALSGIYPDFDRNRLISDLKRICETELAIFSSPAPFENICSCSM